MNCKLNQALILALFVSTLFSSLCRSESKRVKWLFERLDKNNDGKISKEEVGKNWERLKKSRFE